MHYDSIIPATSISVREKVKETEIKRKRKKGEKKKYVEVKGPFFLNWQVSNQTTRAYSSIHRNDPLLMQLGLDPPEFVPPAGEHLLHREAGLRQLGQRPGILFPSLLRRLSCHGGRKRSG